MQLNRKSAIYSSILLVVCSTQIYASDHKHEREHEHEHEQHESHVHGEASLLVALEGSDLEIEFLSPAANIVGFEHKPSNKAQKRAVESAVAALKQADQLFGFPVAAKCQLLEAEVETPMLEDDDHDHKHEEEHKHDEEEGHSDFTAHYHFKCADAAQLDSIQIGLFEKFPATEVIEVQSISKQGQQKIDLKPGDSILKL